MSYDHVSLSYSLSQTLQDTFKSRKLLVGPPSDLALASASSNGTDLSPRTVDNVQEQEPFEGVDANLALILAVLLCALVCVIGLNFIARCALQSSRRRILWENWRATRAANTGLKRKVLMSLPKLIYTTTLILAGFDAVCAICLSEFLEGELVRVLPNCNHSFHVKCIDAWLTSHSSCPICRHCLRVNTSKKTTHCCIQGSTERFPLRPLEREGLIINYRDS